MRTCFNKQNPANPQNSNKVFYLAYVSSILWLIPIMPENYLVLALPLFLCWLLLVQSWYFSCSDLWYEPTFVRSVFVLLGRPGRKLRNLPFWAYCTLSYWLVNVSGLLTAWVHARLESLFFSGSQQALWLPGAFLSVCLHEGRHCNGSSQLLEPVMICTHLPLWTWSKSCSFHFLQAHWQF